MDTNEQKSVGAGTAPGGADSGSAMEAYTDAVGGSSEHMTDHPSGDGSGEGVGTNEHAVDGEESFEGSSSGDGQSGAVDANGKATATDAGEGKAGKDEAGTGKAKPGRTTENATNADRRRAQKQQAAIDAAVAKAKVEATIEALGGVNPFTQKPMKDAHDVAVYERQRAIKRAGGDPVQDYADQIAREQREAQEAADTEAERARWFAEDAKAFRDAHPRVNLTEVLEDPDFAAFAVGRLGQVSLGELYDGYTAMRERIAAAAQRSADERAARDVANAQAASGSASGRGSAPTMSRAELMSKPTSEIMKLANENPELYRTIMNGH